MSAASPIAAYAPWHARGAIPRAAAPLGLFAVLGGLPLWTLVNQYGLDAVRAGGEPQGMAMLTYRQVTMLAMTLGAIVIASGFVALDRERQYFRFLFPHPIVPWQYYLQQFAINVLCFAAAMALIPLGFGLLFVEVPVLPVVLSALMYGLLFGSLAMLCSALLNRDGLIFIGVLILTISLQQAAAAGGVPVWLDALADALPPLVVADGIRGRWLGGDTASTGAIVHVLAYSLGLLASALFVIRRAPLAR